MRLHQCAPLGHSGPGAELSLPGAVAPLHLGTVRLWARDRQMDRQTDTAHHFIMPLPTEFGGITVQQPECTHRVRTHAVLLLSVSPPSEYSG